MSHLSASSASTLPILSTLFTCHEQPRLTCAPRPPLRPTTSAPSSTHAEEDHGPPPWRISPPQVSSLPIPRQPHHSSRSKCLGTLPQCPPPSPAAPISTRRFPADSMGARVALSTHSTCATGGRLSWPDITQLVQLYLMRVTGTLAGC
ncbi:hypothetical protein GWK47_045127 [Chionoecetes opilio]|uniref:Uncharacterized protein n=1 Tax=Chionoecetes opilio TaxID=41210 RepID=A0A8J5CHS6_CHIOP|nr:hypothetical protein GWK47_045127 [Chionoecetes opilio]